MKRQLRGELLEIDAGSVVAEIVGFETAEAQFREARQRSLEVDVHLELGVGHAELL